MVLELSLEGQVTERRGLEGPESTGQELWEQGTRSVEGTRSLRRGLQLNGAGKTG